MGLGYYEKAMELVIQYYKTMFFIVEDKQFVIITIITATILFHNSSF